MTDKREEHVYDKLVKLLHEMNKEAKGMVKRAEPKEVAKWLERYSPLNR
jgi:hypothetical protein